MDQKIDPSLLSEGSRATDTSVTLTFPEPISTSRTRTSPETSQTPSGKKIVKQNPEGVQSNLMNLSDHSGAQTLPPWIWTRLYVDPITTSNHTTLCFSLISCSSLVIRTMLFSSNRLALLVLLAHLFHRSQYNSQHRVATLSLLYRFFACYPRR